MPHPRQARENNRRGNKKKGSPGCGAPHLFAVFRDCYCWKDCENPCAALDRYPGSLTAKSSK